MNLSAIFLTHSLSLSASMRIFQWAELIRIGAAAHGYGFTMHLTNLVGPINSVQGFQITEIFNPRTLPFHLLH